MAEKITLYRNKRDKVRKVPAGTQVDRMIQGTGVTRTRLRNKGVKGQLRHGPDVPDSAEIQRHKKTDKGRKPVPSVRRFKKDQSRFRNKNGGDSY